MYTTEELKNQVNSRISELKNTLDDLKSQYDNQTIDAAVIVVSIS